MSSLENHKRFMKYALKLANHALYSGEVPVACVFIYNDQVISHGMNNTNDSLSGINHAEFQGINKILEKLKEADPKNQIYYNHQDIFKEIDLYVTVEPCVMCASALKQIGIRSVYFGCGNERFGGNGSVLKINSDKTLSSNNYKSYPGIYRKESILLLRDFYTHENSKAPTPRDKKNRNLNTETFPELDWSKYLSQEEFVDEFGEEALINYDENKDIFEDVDTSILDSNNVDITSILKSTNSPLIFEYFKRRRLS